MDTEQARRREGPGKYPRCARAEISSAEIGSCYLFLPRFPAGAKAGRFKPAEAGWDECGARWFNPCLSTGLTGDKPAEAGSEWKWMCLASNHRQVTRSSRR